MTTSLILTGMALVVVSVRPSRRLGAPNTMLRRARSPYRIMAITIVIAVLTMAGLGNLSVTLAATMVTGLAVFLFDAQRTKTRRVKAEAATESVLTQVVAELKAGALVVSAFSKASEDLPPGTPTDIRERLQLAATHVRHGGTGYTVLESSPEMAPIARLWKLSEHHGLPAAVLFDHARARLAARRRHRSATSAALQGPQATALILTFLPVLGVGLGSSMGADPVGFLVGGGIGGLLLVLGVGLICAGMVISHVIITKAAT